MKLFPFIACLFITMAAIGQNHSEKSIRFIFESIHDHLGNLDINSKRVKLFNHKNDLLYEADLYDGKELDEQFFYYTEDGKLLRDHRIFHQPHESGDFRMTYDAKGNLIEETNVNDIDEVLERISMTYNDKGQMITHEVEFLHRSQGHMIVESSFSFTYNSDGKIATKTGYEDEKVDQIITYKYVHTESSEAISKFNSSNVILEKWVDNFDDKGRLLKKTDTRYTNGLSPISRTIDFTYDEFDHILTEVMTKSNSQLKKQILFEYTYDEFGNWTERKEKILKGVRESKGVHLVRVIEYYEDTYKHPPMELDESFLWENRGGKEVKVFQETHVRINNNAGDLEWVVRRNGPAIYQLDEYEYEDGKLVRINHLNNEKKENLYTIAKHNDKGLMTEQASYSFTDAVDEKINYEYDAKGLLIKKEESFTGPSHGSLKVEIIEEYKYNSEGVLSKVNLTEYGSKYVVEYEYDASGNVIKEVQSPDAKGEDVITTTYVYKDGRLVSESEFEGKSKTPSENVSFEYDARGELIRTAHHRDGKIHSEVDYVYFE